MSWLGQTKELVAGEGQGGCGSPGVTLSPALHLQSTCDPMPNHSETISHTVNVPLQATLGTLEEIAC